MAYIPVELKQETQYVRYAMKKKVNPDRIIQTTQEYFKDVLTKPNIKNLALTNIAIAKSEKTTINEIARCLPVDVKKQKSKQTRLLRFLDNDLPVNDMMFSWSRLVLQRIYANNDDAIIILVDGVSLMRVFMRYKKK